MKSVKLIAGLVILVLLGQANAVFGGELSTPIRFAVLGDRTGSTQPGIYEQVCREIEQLRPDFVTTVGDMIEGPTTDSTEYVEKWKEYEAIVSQFTMPYYRMPGNNDIYSDFEERMYRQVFGEPYYSADFRNLHIITLDNGRWGDVESFESSEIGKKEIAWLIDDLEKHQDAAYTFVFFHVPFWYNTIAQSKPDTLHTIFKKYGVDAVFSGHFHNYFSGEYDGIKYTNIGSSGGHMSPDPTGLEYHYGWVTVDNDGIHINPIKLGSVLPWDVVTAADRLAFTPIEMFGEVFTKPAKVNNDLTVTNAEIELTLDNSSSSAPLNSAVEWNIPESWTITPQIDSVKADPGEKKVYSFTASCNGQLYPTPTAEVTFNYAEGKTVKTSAFVKTTRIANCHKAGKVKIDGELSDKCWMEAQDILFNNDGTASKTEPVKFYFAYNKDNLYLGAYCKESEPGKITAKVTEHDGPIFREDCVGYFIEPSYGSDSLYQIYFSPLGTVYDAQYWKDDYGFTGGTTKWNGEYEIATKKGDDFWSMEARIPLEQFGLKYQEGDKVRINFRRKDKRVGANCEWQLPLDWDASTYGELIMK